MDQNQKLVQILFAVIGAGTTFLHIEIKYFSIQPNQFWLKRSLKSFNCESGDCTSFFSQYHPCEQPQFSVSEPRDTLFKLGAMDPPWSYMKYAPIDNRSRRQFAERLVLTRPQLIQCLSAKHFPDKEEGRRDEFSWVGGRTWDPSLVWVISWILEASCGCWWLGVSLRVIRTDNLSPRLTGDWV
jgi:hypothetical protein